MKDRSQILRERVAQVIGLASPRAYLSLMWALERWLAAVLGAALVVVQGSRHGTPFDAVKATNASLLALLAEHSLDPETLHACDEPQPCRPLAFAGSLAEEHALCQ